MNAAFEYEMQKTDKKPDCVVFHDVDLLPESERLLYGCFGYKAHHLRDKSDNYKYQTQVVSGHVIANGGAVTVSSWQYMKVNGHPNRYWGWGYEDWEGGLRFRSYNYSNDIYVPKGRGKENDFMNHYINGTTEVYSDIGMARNEKFGYFTQMKHDHGFTNGYKNGNQSWEHRKT